MKLVDDGKATEITRVNRNFELKTSDKSSSCEVLCPASATVMPSEGQPLTCATPPGVVQSVTWAFLAHSRKYTFSRNNLEISSHLQNANYLQPLSISN